MFMVQWQDYTGFRETTRDLHPPVERERFETFEQANERKKVLQRAGCAACVIQVLQKPPRQRKVFEKTEPSPFSAPLCEIPDRVIKSSYENARRQVEGKTVPWEQLAPSKQAFVKHEMVYTRRPPVMIVKSMMGGPSLGD